MSRYRKRLGRSGGGLAASKTTQLRRRTSTESWSASRSNRRTRSWCSQFGSARPAGPATGPITLYPSTSSNREADMTGRTGRGDWQPSPHRSRSAIRTVSVDDRRDPDQANDLTDQRGNGDRNRADSSDQGKRDDQHHDRREDATSDRRQRTATA